MTLIPRVATSAEISCFGLAKPPSTIWKSFSSSGTDVTIAKVVSRPKGGEASNLKGAPGAGTSRAAPALILA